MAGGGIGDMWGVFKGVLGTRGCYRGSVGDL